MNIYLNLKTKGPEPDNITISIDDIVTELTEDQIKQFMVIFNIILKYLNIKLK